MRHSIIAFLVIAGCSDAEPERTDGGTSAASMDPTDPDSGPLPDFGSMEPRADLGVEPPAACAGYCAEIATCMGTSESDCLLQCDSTYADNAAVSPECSGAYESVLSCVAALSCEEIGAYLDGEGDYPCAAEDTAALSSCSVIDVPPTCVDFCATSSMCTEGSAEQCEVVCSEALAAAEDVSTDCRAEHEAAFACAAALTCEQFDAWSLAEGDYPCLAEDEELLQACEPN